MPSKIKNANVEERGFKGISDIIFHICLYIEYIRIFYKSSSL